ncbi:MAG: AMP-binding protein [Bacteriovoracaceae bacterium]|jgi:long-chain acyl-CoA synthetase|nr:AMP-binding protein [Bacteriovoracaceae bacterium]
MNNINTIPKLFKAYVSKFNDAKAIGTIKNNNVKFLSTNQYFKEVSNISLGLLKIDIQVEQKLIILGETSYQWHSLDIGSISAGITVVPVYPTSTVLELEYIINETSSKLIYVDSVNQYNKFFEIINPPESIKVLLTRFKPTKVQIDFCHKRGIRLLCFEQLVAIGQAEKELSPEIFSIKSHIVTEESIATIIYTSGTTGNPKGAIITQMAFTQMLTNLQLSFSENINDKDSSLVELPLSHVLGRCSSYFHICFGLKTIFGRGMNHFIDDCSIVMPTIAVGVPRVFEKIYFSIKQKLKSGSEVEQKAFDWANKVSESYYNKLDKDLSPSTLEIVKKNIAFKSIFQKINKLFGGKLRFFICGGAPLKKEISMLLRNINLIILEGYGLTETIGPCVVTPTRKQLTGAVGLPIGDVKIKIGQNKEILIKSKALCSGFLHKKVSIFDENGWFRTGDIGHISSEGYLKVTDRLKEIIVTSNGKNVSPQKIEAIMSAQDHIDQFVTIGEGRPFLTGIVAINVDDFTDSFKTFELTKADPLETIAKNEKVKRVISKEINKANLTLAGHEQIKDFKISTRSISLESGHLTPTLKIKRKKVLKEFAREIDAMYNDS